MMRLALLVLVVGCGSKDIGERMQRDKDPQPQQPVAVAIDARAELPFEREVREAEARNEALARDLTALEARIEPVKAAVAAATTNAERDAAKATLDQLAKDRASLEQRIAAAKATVEQARRIRPATVSEACKQDPLAANCEHGDVAISKADRIAIDDATNALRDVEDKLRSLAHMLDEIGTKLAETTAALTDAQMQADRDAAKAALERLRKEKAELEEQIRRARKTGKPVSKACQDNPLAKGCS